MKNFKKTIAVFLASGILCVPAAAGEYKVKIQREDGADNSVVQKIIVEGISEKFSENEQITLKILSENGTASDSPAGYLLIDQAYIAEDGSFRFEKVLDAEPQNINITLTSKQDKYNGENTKYFPSADAIEEIKDGLNNKTLSSSEIAERINNDNINLVFDTEIFNMLSAGGQITAIDKMSAGAEEFTVGNIYSLFDKYVFITAMNEKNSAEDIKKTAEHYEEIAELKNEKVYSLFSELDNTIKPQVYSFMGAKSYEDISDVKKNFFEGCILTGIKNVTSHLNIYDILSNYKTELGIVQEVNIISNPNYKDIILRYLVAEKNNIVSSETLKSKITYAINNFESIKKMINGNTSAPSGGGGGGGGGGATVTLPEPMNNNNAEKVEMPVKTTFSDIGDVSWAEAAIKNLFDKGIIKGKQAGVFAPHDKVTRAELVKMAVEASGVYDSTLRTEFTDLKGHWSDSYIASAYKKGFVSGVSKSEFLPDRQITREDAALILYRVLTFTGKATKVEDMSDVLNYTDNSEISEYAKGGVAMMSAYGIIKGYSDGTLRPKANLTRAEAAVLVDRFLSLK